MNRRTTERMNARMGELAHEHMGKTPVIRPTIERIGGPVNAQGAE